MEIYKVVGIGFITLVTSNLLKEYKKEYSIYVVLFGAMILFFMSINEIDGIINFINNLQGKLSSTKIPFISVILKTTGIAILVEYAVSICKDAGENAISSKIDFCGKVIIISMTIPVLSECLETFSRILP